MRLQLRSLLAAVAMMIALPAYVRAVDFAVWSNPTAGTVNGVNLSASYTYSASNALATSDFSNSSIYNPPGSATQGSLYVSDKSGITWTFSSAVSKVGIYMEGWRTANVSGPTDNLYTFSQAPTILSGLTGVTVSGNNLNVSGSPTNFFNGIVYFAGPLTSLSLSAPNVNPSSIGIVGYTLAVNINTVPEPSTYALAAIATGVITAIARRRKAGRA